MGLARNFAVGLPKACGVPEGLDELYADHQGRLFDFDLQHGDGATHRRNFKGYEDRLLPGFSWKAYAANQGAVDYALDLAVYAAKCIDVNTKGAEIKGLADDRVMLEADELDHPEVAALLTVEQASTMTAWN